MLVVHFILLILQVQSYAATHGSIQNVATHATTFLPAETHAKTHVETLAYDGILQLLRCFFIGNVVIAHV